MLLTNTPQQSFLLDTGIYALRVDEAEYKTTDKGKDYIEFVYEVFDGPRTGQKVKFQKLWITPESAWMFFQFLAATTGQTFEKGEQVEIKKGVEATFIDKEFCAKMGTYTYKKRDGSQGEGNQPESVDYCFFHSIDAYPAMKAAWDIEHGTVEDAGDAFDNDPLGDLDDHPF